MIRPPRTRAAVVALNGLHHIEMPAEPASLGPRPGLYRRSFRWSCPCRSCIDGADLTAAERSTAWRRIEACPRCGHRLAYHRAPWASLLQRPRRAGIRAAPAALNTALRGSLRPPVPTRGSTTSVGLTVMLLPAIPLPAPLRAHARTAARTVPFRRPVGQRPRRRRPTLRVWWVGRTPGVKSCPVCPPVCP